MNPIHEKRDITIPIRVTQQEKDQISMNAKAYGGSVSEFAREQLLRPDSDSTGSAKLQAIARELCRLCELIKNPDDIQLRSNLEEWSASIWQYMK